MLYEPPEGITLKDLVTYAKLSVAQAAAKKRLERLNAKIKTAFAGNKKGVYSYPGVIVDLGNQDRFDAEKATESYPLDEFPEDYVTVTVIDPEKVKKNHPSAADKKNYIKPTATLSIKLTE